MYVFDMYLDGEREGINWNFNSPHLQERLKMNRLSMSYLKDTILNKCPNYHVLSDQKINRYEVFYDAPETKGYDEIKVILECVKNGIAVITVMPDVEIDYFKS